MVDLAKTWTAVLVFWRVAMILYAKRPDLLPAGFDVGNRIVVLVVEYVTGVIADLDTGIADLRYDACAIGACCGIAAVLLDDQRHAGTTRGRSELFQVVDPNLVLAGLDCAEREYKRYFRGGGLRYAVSVKAD